MLKFVTAFLFAYRHLIKGSFSKKNIATFALQHRRGIENLPKSMLNNFSWRSVKAFTFFGLGSQLYFFFLLVLLSLIVKHGQVALDSSSLSWVLQYSPISVNDIIHAFAWLGIMNFGWIMFVGLNHWNDIANLWIQLDISSWYSVFGALSSFWYVTCWTMGYEFFGTLFSNPVDLFSTQAVIELTIGYNNLLATLSVGYTWVLSHAPELISPFLENIKSVVSTVWNTSTFYIFGIFKSSWIWLVSGISTAITPSVPVIIQPVVDGLVAPAAKMIAVSILLWILRIIFGYPF